jgi:probable rRNA maturation factor
VSVMITGRMSKDLQAALQRFTRRARRELGLSGDITVLLTSNTEMRALNRRFRQQNKATDVLSFPIPHAGQGPVSGDIAISTEIARQQASRLGYTLEQELKILLLHGLLHLAGYDHERDRGEMFHKERRLRSRLGLPNSLTERSVRRRVTP